VCELVDCGIVEELLYYLPKIDDTADNQLVVESIFDLLYHIPSILLLNSKLKKFEVMVMEFKKHKGFS
jgi:hypothetical protein